MKKVTFLFIVVLSVVTSINSFGAYSSVSVSAFRGSTDSDQKTVTLQAGVYGSYSITASAGGMHGDARAYASAEVRGTNFVKYVSAYVEALDSDYNRKSGTVGSSSQSETYTIKVYATTEGKSNSSASASISW